ncbi:MAG: tRNA-dihydrouridine synthase family protein [Parcubacteria group bacterium]
MLKNSNIKLVLAPMAGFTDKAMRQICQELGADITWSEMVSAEGVFRSQKKENKSLALAEKFSIQEKNFWVQIFGKEAISMSESAKIITRKIKPLGIDINLGCPVKKAQKAGYGAAQMGDIKNVIKIIKSIKKSTPLPLSIKTRLGLKSPEEILIFAPQLEKAGIDQLVVHARTLQGMFHEKPDWKIIKKLNSLLKIPIIYNGGIKNPQDAKFYLTKTNCQALMIGQAAIGNPWIFKEIKEFINFGEFTLPTLKEKKRIILKHAQLVKKYYGEKGFVTFRAQLSAYLKGHPQATALRAEAVRINNLKNVKDILKKM